jgi:hypothetical protein
MSNAQHLPALNLHLTKSRLNDAPRLCEMLGWIYAGHRTQGPHSREQLELQLSNAAKRNKVEPFWMQGE